jgi:hypothetical protein
MTDKQALKEAQRRWGKYACVRNNERFALTHAVGFVMLGMFFEVKGQGNTYEEAFADADKTGRGGKK